MDAAELIRLITGLFTTGGIFYLLVEKVCGVRESQAKVKHQEVENKKETVEYGVSMVTIYNEIDKIVESKTRPIQTKLDKALDRINQLEKYYCYKENCPDREQRDKDCVRAHFIDKLGKLNTACNNKEDSDEEM